MPAFEITDADFHSHILERMHQRGVSKDEGRYVVNRGWEAEDAKPGTVGRTYVFPFGQEWEGRLYLEKEVTVYFKPRSGKSLLLTVKARYGSGFQRKDK